MRPAGKLYICATPIGNLEDITLRVLRILKEADLVAAEDTRETRKLFNRYQIKTPLTSYHQNNEIAKGKVLLEKLRQGKMIALVSKAGMPGISDPGHKLIKNCIEAEIDLEILPGPSAAVTALVVSGLPAHSFTYLGFLPRRKEQRRKLLQKFTSEERTLLFYESPHRLQASLKEILEILGDREIAVARELTKKFEEVIRGTISTVLKRINESNPRGEIVLVVEGTTEKPDLGEAFLRAEVTKLMKKGVPKKEAIQRTAQERKVSKRQVYEAVKYLPATKKSQL